MIAGIIAACARRNTAGTSSYAASRACTQLNACGLSTTASTDDHVATPGEPPAPATSDASQTSAESIDEAARLGADQATHVPSSSLLPVPLKHSPLAALQLKGVLPIWQLHRDWRPKAFRVENLLAKAQTIDEIEMVLAHHGHMITGRAVCNAAMSTMRILKPREWSAPKYRPVDPQRRQRGKSDRVMRMDEQMAARMRAMFAHLVPAIKRDIAMIKPKPLISALTALHKLGLKPGPLLAQPMLQHVGSCMGAAGMPDSIELDYLAGMFSGLAIMEAPYRDFILQHEQELVLRLQQGEGSMSSLCSLAWALANAGLANSQVMQALQHQLELKGFPDGAMPTQAPVVLWALATTPSPSPVLFARAAPLILANMDRVQPQQVASTVWALGKAEVRDQQQLVEALMARCASSAHSFTSSELSTIIAGVNYIGVDISAELWAAVTPILTQRMLSMDPVEVASVCFVSTKQAHYSEQFMTGLDGYVQRHAATLPLVPSTNILCHLVSDKDGRERHAATIRKLITLTSAKMRGPVGSQPLPSMVTGVFSLAMVNHYSIAILEKVSQEVQARLPEMDLPSTSVLMWACGQLMYYDEPLLRALCSVVRGGLGQMRAQNFVAVLWAMQRLGHEDQELLEGLSRIFLRSIHTMRPGHFASGVKAFAALRWGDAAFWARVSDHLAACSGQLSDQELRQLYPAMLAHLPPGQLPHMGQLAEAEALRTGRAAGAGRAGAGEGSEREEAPQDAVASLMAGMEGQDELTARTMGKRQRRQQQQEQEQQGLGSAEGQQGLPPEAAGVAGQAGSGGAAGLVVPPELVGAVALAWRASHDPTVSDLQKDVAKVLRKLGYQVQLEVLDERCLVGVDMVVALPDGRRLAVEVDGPDHYSRTLPRRYSGRYALRNAILERYGWQVVQVPFFEWNASLMQGDVVGYARRKMRAAVGAGGGEGGGKSRRSSRRRGRSVGQGSSSEGSPDESGASSKRRGRSLGRASSSSEGSLDESSSSAKRRGRSLGAASSSSEASSDGSGASSKAGRKASRGQGASKEQGDSKATGSSSKDSPKADGSSSSSSSRARSRPKGSKAVAAGGASEASSKEEGSSTRSRRARSPKQVSSDGSRAAIDSSSGAAAGEPGGSSGSGGRRGAGAAAQVAVEVPAQEVPAQEVPAQEVPAEGQPKRRRRRKAAAAAGEVD